MALNHPNILKVHRCTDVTATQLVLLEDYCPEGILQGHLLYDARIITELAEGLHYLHSVKKRIHLCLTPRNIYIREGRPLIGELFRTSECQDDLTAPYQPPEDSYGYHTDIWSLGMIFLSLALSR